jgi:histone chaperone ASF1
MCGVGPDGPDSILADRPRVTRFPIDWENPQVDPQRKQFDADNLMAAASDEPDALVGDEEEEEGEEEEEEDDGDPSMEVELATADTAAP